MSGQRIGYVRVSTFEQNPDRQIEALKVDKLFVDKASGKDRNRPQLDALIDYVREGDTIVVHSLDRLGRNLDDLRQLVNGFTEQGIKVEFVKDNLTFTNEKSSMSLLLLSVMGAFAEFERAKIKERQMEGIVIAKKKGVYKGRKKSLTQQQTDDIVARVKSGEKKAKIARKFGISRETLYQYLRKNEAL